MTEHPQPGWTERSHSPLPEHLATELRAVIVEAARAAARGDTEAPDLNMQIVRDEAKYAHDHGISLTPHSPPSPQLDRIRVATSAALASGWSIVDVTSYARRVNPSIRFETCADYWRSRN
ncbi:MAG: hypothetical protein WCF36_12045 [Candidatus Nanopelagicales bacterium]